MAARAPPSVAPPCQRNPGKDLLGKSVKQNTKLQKKTSTSTQLEQRKVLCCLLTNSEKMYLDKSFRVITENQCKCYVHKQVY